VERAAVAKDANGLDMGVKGLLIIVNPVDGRPVEGSSWCQAILVHMTRCQFVGAFLAGQLALNRKGNPNMPCTDKLMSEELKTLRQIAREAELRRTREAQEKAKKLTHELRRKYGSLNRQSD
jgi:hypothetical protein